jgi:hypothetical protein
MLLCCAVLSARLFEAELRRQQEELRAQRMSQVSNTWWPYDACPVANVPSLHSLHSSHAHSSLLRQVGTGDRSEKIKTYNYKDSRCSDHRLKQNYDLNKQMDGELEDNIQVRGGGGTHTHCVAVCLQVELAALVVGQGAVWCVRLGVGARVVASRQGSLQQGPDCQLGTGV